MWWARYICKCIKIIHIVIFPTFVKLQVAVLTNFSLTNFNHTSVFQQDFPWKRTGLIFYRGKIFCQITTIFSSSYSIVKTRRVKTIAKNYRYIDFKVEPTKKIKITKWNWGIRREFLFDGTKRRRAKKAHQNQRVSLQRPRLPTNSHKSKTCAWKKPKIGYIM